MEFDDYKLAPENYEEMAKAYYSSLKTCSFEFVKKKNNDTEKQTLLDELVTKYSSLFSYIEFLKKTKTARSKSSIVNAISDKANCCKNSCNFLSSNIQTKNLNSNLCDTLKNIIDVSAEIIAICQAISEYTTNEIDDNICDSTDNLLSIIKNAVSLFGQCHYRY